jgi:ABC-2 type transport system ATP-binding protein
MQEVDAICDRIVIIDNGRIIADGNSQNVRNTVVEKKATIIIEFESAINTDQLVSIGGVTAATSIGGNKYLIESPAGVDKRKELFNWAVSSSNAILGMQKMERSLEDVFRELTAK